MGGGSVAVVGEMRCGQGHERASSALGAPREAASAGWGLGRVVRDAAGRPEHGFRHTGEQEGLPPGHACEREADRTAVDPGAQATHLASPLTHLRPLRRIADRPPGLPAARRGPSPPVGVSAGASDGRRRRSPAAPPERLQDRLQRLSRRGRRYPPRAVMARGGRSAGAACDGPGCAVTGSVEAGTSSIVGPTRSSTAGRLSGDGFGAAGVSSGWSGDGSSPEDAAVSQAGKGPIDAAAGRLPGTDVSSVRAERPSGPPSGKGARGTGTAWPPAASGPAAAATTGPPAAEGPAAVGAVGTPAGERLAAVGAAGSRAAAELAADAAVGPPNSAPPGTVGAAGPHAAADPAAEGITGPPAVAGPATEVAAKPPSDSAFPPPNEPTGRASGSGPSSECVVSHSSDGSSGGSRHR